MTSVATSAPAAPLELTPHFSALAGGYDALLCDVWGVVHNGVVAPPEASDALVRFRAGGGRVVLISNAPRPGSVVARQLATLRVPRAAYDAIVTSGDVTRGIIAEHGDAPVFQLGPPRDEAVFEGLAAPRVRFEDAAYVVCTGLFDDETQTPDDYRGLLERMRARELAMICANPDVVVERGERLLYCAGALADLYAQMGGAVVYTGKPYRPIYERALRQAEAARGGGIAPERVLAIGDSLRTDVAGAQGFGIDCLFVTSGIHAEALGARDQPDLRKLARLFAQAGVAPKAATTRLAW